ncbi:hypothetical protein K457DRAFT_155908 [Linnemannia elongata AG-77]|uniref:Uncharacterized protein n=1 Tax=Linnemannia elongata AG-77 TaxID=1314771 RepID=A0A197JXJ5_9FUNG|nr:hypothetical protein K457DRAFT_155908 [Linnemannia elongata AG-77]
MSDNVYAKISEKMKNERFTDEEIKIVEKAKEQLSSYTTGGSVVGGAVGLMLARAKNFKGLQAMAIGMGGLLIGSQMGIIMGAMASVRTIQSIPNFQRVINIVQEVREEGAAAAGAPVTPRHRSGGPMQHDRAASMPSAGTQRFPIQPRLGSELMTDDAVAQQAHPEQEFKGGDGYHGGRDPGSSGSSTARQDSAWAHVDQRAKEIHNNSPGWSQIRQQNMPRSAWNDVREGRSHTRSTNDSPSDEHDDHDHRHHDGLGSDSKRSNTTSSSTKTSSWDRIRKGEVGVDGYVGVSGTGAVVDGPSEFPRTREDLENRPSRVKNQYGDAM